MKEQQPDESKIVKLEGPHSETVFSRPIEWCLEEDSRVKLQEEVNALMNHVADLNEDRLLVLVGALLVENKIHEFLSFIIPNYQSLLENRDFTLSMRIDLANALKLCPSRIFSCAHIIRKIRNDFVHDLSCQSFTNLNEGRLQSMRNQLAGFNPAFIVDKSDRQIFKDLVIMVAIALWVYCRHVIWLNKFIRSKDFYQVLRPFCEARER